MDHATTRTDTGTTETRTSDLNNDTTTGTMDAEADTETDTTDKTDTTAATAETSTTEIATKDNTRTTDNANPTATTPKMMDHLTNTTDLPHATEGPTNRTLMTSLTPSTPSDNTNNTKNNKDLETMDSKQFTHQSISQQSTPTNNSTIINNPIPAIRPGRGIASITSTLQNKHRNQQLQDTSNIEPSTQTLHKLHLIAVILQKNFQHNL